MMNIHKSTFISYSLASFVWRAGLITCLFALVVTEPQPSYRGTSCQVLDIRVLFCGSDARQRCVLPTPLRAVVLPDWCPHHPVTSKLRSRPVVGARTRATDERQYADAAHARRAVAQRGGPNEALAITPISKVKFGQHGATREMRLCLADTHSCAYFFRWVHPGPNTCLDSC